MSRIVYIQTRESGELLNTNAYAAWDGFTQRGYDVRLFTVQQLNDLPLSRETIVHGGIPTVRAAFRRVGAPLPPYINAPKEVAKFLRRSQWETTLGEIQTLRRVPVFIKPLKEGKGFTGHVVRAFKDLVETAGLPSDYPVLAQDVVNFRSEWRVFVLRREIWGIGHYKGDPLLFPNPDVARQVLAAWKNPFAAYSIDVGVTDKGETLLVEMNDAYALGHYGLPPLRYTAMIEARWDEMCRAKEEA